VALSEGEAEPSEGPSGRLQEQVVEVLWTELETAARDRLGALTLDDLLRRAAAAGLRRPATEPITFAI
jgi:DNA-binding IscR family transcriptional regulator